MGIFSGKYGGKREADWRLFTQNLPIKISGHVVSDKKLGILFYISLSEEKTRNLRRLFSLFYKKGSGFQTTSQKHGARTLYVLSKKGSRSEIFVLNWEKLFRRQLHTPLIRGGIAKNRGKREYFLSLEAEAE